MREEFNRPVLSSKSPRITPAHAGRIIDIPGQPIKFEDHPRACGKNCHIVVNGQPGVGSPPRMREEFSSVKTIIMKFGITPAHAGRIHCCEVYRPNNKDHPRACGKNHVCPAHVTSSVGSPPRMREEFREAQNRCRGVGITPAHAGRICSGVALRI